MATNQRLWVSDNGDVICDEHAGVYLSSAIRKYPKSKIHPTPIGSFIACTIEDTELPCSTCVDWMTLDLSKVGA